MKILRDERVPREKEKMKSIERNLDNKTNEANYAETWNNLLEIVANDVFMPNTVQEALRSKYKKYWIIAINEKLGNYDTHKTIGYLIYVGCALICWKSKKKRKLTRSTTNTEYYSFIMDHIKENFINMSYLSPNNMLTDVLTTFERFIDNTFVY
ncbi:hypothetical protein PIROE2DRAFT_3367 [Piromyces sp. E2]|nr:hypothetical protein PIROE2DRAFT_3367 [Piromyces sp. E2]|eukprot:OUM68847.1 hypothetical protein PIROE2DRAFT_3367 [Piromyces sp. E2]